MGSFASQALVIDALLAMCAGLSAVQNANPPVSVFDGFPGPNFPASFIAIGGFGEDVVLAGRTEWADIGARSRYESYEILGYAYAWVGGDDNLGQASPSDAQKAARDQASGLVQAVEAGLLHDPALTAQNGGSPLVTWTRLAVTKVSQTGPDDPDVEKGRWAQYDFCIEVSNRLSGAY